MRGRGWFETAEVEAGLSLVTEPAVHVFFRANLYLLRGSACDLVVDTGMGLRPLRPALPLTPDKPVVAVATHIHLDHVGGLHEFDDRAGPAASAPVFSTMPDVLTYASMYRDFPGAAEWPPSPGWTSQAYAIVPAPLGRALAEGDRIELGDRRLLVLELPGHSPDSIGLLDEADGLFFSGDAIYPGGLIDDLPDSDRQAYAQTMRRIRDLPVRLACGGHGEVMDRAAMRAIAEAYLRGAEG